LIFFVNFLIFFYEICIWFNTVETCHRCYTLMLKVEGPHNLVTKETVPWLMLMAQKS